MNWTPKIIALFISVILVSAISSYVVGNYLGYEKGWQVGNDNGYKNGKIEGHQAGYDEGDKAGYTTGYDAGRSSVVVDVAGNANRLKNEYQDKLNLVDEIQKRTDALGSSAGISYYVEWANRNGAAILAGDQLSSYIQEHVKDLNTEWTVNAVSWVSTNKERLSRDNQGLIQTISQMQSTLQSTQAQQYYNQGYNQGYKDGEAAICNQLPGGCR